MIRSGPNSAVETVVVVAVDPFEFCELVVTTKEVSEVNDDAVCCNVVVSEFTVVFA
jgi:hypothetical protein